MISLLVRCSPSCVSCQVSAFFTDLNLAREILHLLQFLSWKIYSRCRRVVTRVIAEFLLSFGLIVVICSLHKIPCTTLIAILSRTETRTLKWPNIHRRANGTEYSNGSPERAEFGFWSAPGIGRCHCIRHSSLRRKHPPVSGSALSVNSIFEHSWFHFLLSTLRK